MLTTPKNTNARPCDHDFVPSLYEAGVEVCAWKCGETREAELVAGDTAAVQLVTIEATGRAA